MIMAEVKKEKTGFGTAGLVLGIIGIVLSFIPIINNIAFFLGALAIIFAIICFIKKKSIGVAITAIILGILSVVITLTMQAAALKVIDDVSKSIDDATSSLSNSLDDMTGDNTEKILNNNLDVSFGKFEIVKDDFFDNYKLPVTVKNKGTENKSFSIKIEAVDSNGTRLDDDTIYVDSLNAGQSQNLEAFTLITSETAEKLATAEFKVLEVSMY